MVQNQAVVSLGYYLGESARVWLLFSSEDMSLGQVEQTGADSEITKAWVHMKHKLASTSAIPTTILSI